MLRPRDPNPHRIWTEERLRSSLATSFSSESIVVPANREPDRHDRSADGSVGVGRSSGGLVTAVEPLIQACSGVWVAHGSGAADLVAQEFVAARDDHRGVLILSQFAGAARQLTSALTVNPYATDECAEATVRALGMSDEEQSTRRFAMRAVVAKFNTYRWAGEMLADAGRLRADLMHVPQDRGASCRRKLLSA
jgi:trehalose-6-phosphate synthase